MTFFLFLSKIIWKNRILETFFKSGKIFWDIESKYDMIQLKEFSFLLLELKMQTEISFILDIKVWLNEVLI